MSAIVAGRLYCRCTRRCVERLQRLHESRMGRVGQAGPSGVVPNVEELPTHRQRRSNSAACDASRGPGGIAALVEGRGSIIAAARFVGIRTSVPCGHRNKWLVHCGSRCFQSL